MTAPPETCPVCRAPAPQPFMDVGPQHYLMCAHCDARFLDPAQLPPPQVERAHYLTHENDPADPRYRNFLSKLATPLLARLAPTSSGLDYGCGPGPALAAMLREAGHETALYDPFFHADESALARSYDFIACTETAEHFHRPVDEFDRLDALLRPGGWLGVMTAFRPEDDAFATWHYRKDPTHVVFYNEKTLRTVAHAHNWTCEFPAPDVALMRKAL
ncbi:class I SAM-dependent methyltransferase [uncultured Parvibaculum sp.]|uniref:class I SAM-dependent methyltransferase n=1 Tax=uncultured Parvibaculum sp. TaxID=291828 RepID=UPI0030EF09DB|tara:strand:+ start:136569 stop:137219 length:651 start_codon:yes stop_codon:yes gene_type:complete